MNHLKVTLESGSFSTEIHMKGSVANAHLRQALLQVIKAVSDEERFFENFHLRPANTYRYSDLIDPLWRATHSHTIQNTKQAGFELRMKRLKIGLTALQFSKLAGITHPYLSKVEHGHKPLSEKLRVRAESIFRSFALSSEHAHVSLATVAPEGQTYLEDLNLEVESLDELKEWFKNAES